MHCARMRSGAPLVLLALSTVTGCGNSETRAKWIRAREMVADFPWEAEAGAGQPDTLPAVGAAEDRTGPLKRAPANEVEGPLSPTDSGRDSVR